MKNANFSRSFFAFLGMVLVGVVALILFTEPPKPTQAAGMGDAGAAMDSGHVFIEPANAPPVVEARLISDTELAAATAADVAVPTSTEISSTAASVAASARDTVAAAKKM